MWDCDFEGWTISMFAPEINFHLPRFLQNFWLHKSIGQSSTKGRFACKLVHRHVWLLRLQLSPVINYQSKNDKPLPCAANATRLTFTMVQSAHGTSVALVKFVYSVQHLKKKPVRVDVDLIIVSMINRVCPPFNVKLQC